MSAWALAATAGLSTCVWMRQPAPALRRLRSDAVGSAAPRPVRDAPPGAAGAGWLASTRGRRTTAALAGGAALFLVPHWWGLFFAAGVAAGLDRWFARLPDRSTLAGQREASRQLPLALDLMAAALSAGATVDAAVALAARATGPPLGAVLQGVAASLRLGGSSDEAWLLAREDPVLRPVARLAVRSAASGSAMAVACRDLAARSRVAAVAEADVAIKRAGVLAVLPLALCFLPAFVLVGVVPVVVGLLGSLAL